MSEGLMKLLVARKSGSAGRQSGTLGLANPGRELSLADLSKKLTKRNLANVCVLLQCRSQDGSAKAVVPRQIFLLGLEFP